MVFANSRTDRQWCIAFFRTPPLRVCPYKPNSRSFSRSRVRKCSTQRCSKLLIEYLLGYAPPREHRSLPPPLRSSSAGGLETCDGSLPNQIALELSERSKDVEDEATRR
jgi:hypothetical protein